jgi:hypothetical protein
LGNYGIEFSIQLSFSILFETLIAHAQPNSVPFLNTGSLEYDEWSSHRQAWKLESAAIIEPPINFIVSSHSKGKKRYYYFGYSSLLNARTVCNELFFKTEVVVISDLDGLLSTRHSCTIPGGLHRHPIIFTVQVGITVHLNT